MQSTPGGQRLGAGLRSGPRAPACRNSNVSIRGRNESGAGTKCARAADRTIYSQRDEFCRTPGDHSRQCGPGVTNLVIFRP